MKEITALCIAIIIISGITGCAQLPVRSNNESSLIVCRFTVYKALTSNSTTYYINNNEDLSGTDGASIKSMAYKSYNFFPNLQAGTYTLKDIRAYFTPDIQFPGEDEILPLKGAQAFTIDKPGVYFIGTYDVNLGDGFDEAVKRTDGDKDPELLRDSAGTNNYGWDFNDIKIISNAFRTNSFEIKLYENNIFLGPIKVSDKTNKSVTNN